MTISYFLASIALTILFYILKRFNILEEVMITIIQLTIYLVVTGVLIFLPLKLTPIFWLITIPAFFFFNCFMFKQIKETLKDVNKSIDRPKVTLPKSKPLNNNNYDISDVE